MKALLLRIFVCFGAVVCAVGHTRPVMAWNTNSTIKVQQLIGEQGTTNYSQDTNRQTGSNLLNQTYGLYRVGGTDVGSSFEFNGRIHFHANPTNWTTLALSDAI